MIEDTQFLKKRAVEFWERAKEDFQKQRYNLCALDVEQAVQLWLKYLIFQKAGDFPRTHYLDILINNLVELYQSLELRRFYKQNALQFKSLEDAYLTSGYLPKEFNQEEAKKFISFAKTIFKILEKATNEKFI